ncbi:WD40/YVTN/BNR-like repeat-containing protein [Paenibacillus kobensis]|uniref:WD40/YVTN/BNR-like repeat-containing protein n=1 Tax=Paenibacillus kobensis TaxID=59841 RepID=UPI0013E3C0E9|nr:hypothetical protein [Paenibacillus kobensis]
MNRSTIIYVFIFLALMVGCSQGDANDVTQPPKLKDTPPKSSLKFNAINMITEQKGWALAVQGDQNGILPNALYSTHDGGQSWETIPIPSLLRTGVYAQWDFRDDQTVWVILQHQDAGKVYLTRDGGKTWFERKVDVKGEIPELRSLDSNIAWVTDVTYASGGSPNNNIEIHFTSDGGDTWQKIAEESNVPEVGQKGAAQPFSHETAWIPVTDMNSQPYAYYTLDRGAAWQKKQLALPDQAEPPVRFRGLEYVNLGKGQLAYPIKVTTENGKNEIVIYTSENNGNTWTAQQTLPFEEEEWININIVDKSHGWVVKNSQASLYQFADGKETLVNEAERITGEEGSVFGGIDFVSRQRGFALIGDPNETGKSLYVTDDGGKSWEEK